MILVSSIFGVLRDVPSSYRRTTVFKGQDRYEIAIPPGMTPDAIMAELVERGFLAFDVWFFVFEEEPDARGVYEKYAPRYSL